MKIELETSFVKMNKIRKNKTCYLPVFKLLLVFILIGGTSKIKKNKNLAQGFDHR